MGDTNDWRRKNPKQAKQAAQAWYKKNKESENERMKQWREENKERIQQWRREYRAKHRERLIKQSAEYYKNNLDKSRSYYQRNKKEFSSYGKKYRKEHPLVVHAYVQRRLCRLKGAKVGEVSAADLQLLYERVKLCPYCKVRLTRKNRSLDHIVPLKLGGAHALHNITPACRSCNYRKGARRPV